jgi:hypothetical protein
VVLCNTEAVAALLEIVQESLAHFGGSPLLLFVVRHGCGLRVCEKRRLCGKARSERKLRRVSGEESASELVRWPTVTVTQTMQVIVSSQSCGEHHQSQKQNWRGNRLQVQVSLR